MSKRSDTEIQRKKSRDAARQRRGQQNDEFSELAGQLPVPMKLTSQLDRLCVMRLSNSFVKMKHIIRQITGEMTTIKEESKSEALLQDLSLLDALDGFVFVTSQDGQCLYVSPNVSEYLGIPQLEMTGCSFYKYVHPCDQEDLAQQLGGEVPLEDMEIFDGLFCSDLPSVLKSCVSKPNYKKKHLDSDKCRSFFIRMKSTLTSRGKSVNLNASIYRVIHCVGQVKKYKTKFGQLDTEVDTLCLVGVGTPLLAAPTFDVPLDTKTFTSTHALDLKVISLEDIGLDLMGYSQKEILNRSWYTFLHMNDIDVIKQCHTLMLSKGQSVSGFYRVMTKLGGWLWVKTKGNIVYSNTTFQPQYIININYIVSGVEAREQVLAMQQIQSVIRPTSALKRSAVLDASGSPQHKFRKAFLDFPTPPGSDCSSSEGNLVLSSKKELEQILKNEENYENLLMEQYAVPAVNEPELPALEALASDSDDSFSSSTTDDLCLQTRAPFMTMPVEEKMLYMPEYSPSHIADGDKSSDDESFEELAARAPFIPPPNDDTIIAFDDLADSPGQTMSGFDISCAVDRMPELYLDEGLFDTDDGLVDLGSAIVPSSLLGAKDGSSCLDTFIIGGDGKQSKGDVKKGNLPWISTLEAEANAPAGSLLQGDELLFALAS